MLDILSSPLRGYIAQTLQFYLSKYIEGIQLEGLGLFGGDLVLNDLEIKRHVLVESLEIPSSFDFSRGFIRELRIHIPWTQLLSQPIEVKLYTIELILTAQDESKVSMARRVSRSQSIELTPPRDVAAPEMETPKAGWLRETLNKILANVTIQINNLVLKYEQDDMVLSVALGTLDCYAVNDKKGWLRGFTEPQGPSQVLARGIDARDLTIFLDRYTSDRKVSDPHQHSTIHRRVVGYELPVLSRSTISIRGRICLKPGAEQDEVTVANAIHRKNATFAIGPSKACDPFFQYSCTRSSIVPTSEIDIFIGDLSFSLSDRQLLMLGELLNRTIRSLPTRDLPEAEGSSDLPTEVPSSTSSPQDQLVLISSTVASTMAEEDLATSAPPVKQVDARKNSWMSWAMGALGGPQDDEDDELIAEILAETNEALRRSNQDKKVSTSIGTTPRVTGAPEAAPLKNQQLSRVLCCRVCINLATLTLRKHDEDDSTVVDDSISEDFNVDEQFVPVANIGLVKVSNRPRAKAKQSKPAAEVCSMSLTYSAMEFIISRDDDQDMTDMLTDIVLEVERVKIVYSQGSTMSGNAAKSMASWGNVLDGELGQGSSSSAFSECVSHPYFVASFFGDAARQLVRRESRSFEIVKVSQDVEIPVWKTMDRRKSSHALPLSADPKSACSCALTVHGAQVPCVPLSCLKDVSKTAVASIGIHDRNLDHVAVRAALELGWEKHCREYAFEALGIDADIDEMCKTYRAMRDPDSPATKNLSQFLTPSLYRLLARHCLHSCFFVNLDDASTPEAVDIRARSVHSALRLRYAGAKTSTQTGTTETRDKATNRTRTLLDASLGPLELTLDVPQLSDVLSLLYTIQKKDQGIADNGTAANTTSAPTAAATTDYQSSHLVTLHSASASIVPKVADSSVQVLMQDFSWLASQNSATKGGGWAQTLHLGRGLVQVCPTISSATATEPRDSSQLIDLLAFSWRSSGDADPKLETFSSFSLGKASAEFDWGRLWFTASAIDDVCWAAQWRSFGFDRTDFVMARQRAFGRVELCNWRLERGTKVPREGSADRVIEISCGSCAVHVSHKRGGLGSTASIVEVGCVPFSSSNTDTRARSPMCQFKYQKSKSRQHSYVDAQGHLAIIHLSIHDLNRCIPDACIFLERVQARRSPPRAPTTGPTAAVPFEAKPKYWHTVVKFQCHGAVIQMTPALELSFASIEITPDQSLQSNRRAAIEPGGIIKVGFSCTDVRLVNKWKTLSLPHKDSDHHIVAHLEELTASVLYCQDHVSSCDRHAVDLSVQVNGLLVALDPLSLRHLSKAALFLSSMTNKSGGPSVQSPSPKKADVVNKHHHSLRVGFQVNSMDISLTSNVAEVSASRSSRSVSVVTQLRAQEIGVAYRKANYRPKTDFTDGCDQSFIDLQLSIASLGAQEEHRGWTWDRQQQYGRGRFGSLARLSDRDFLGVLLCLDGRDLDHVARALEFDAQTPTSVDRKSLIASWHAVNRLAQFYREWSEAAPAPLAKLVLRSIHSFPVLAATGATSPQGSNPPVFAAYYRDYGEIRSSPKSLVAASLENIDLVITPTAVASITSLFDYSGRSASSSSTAHQNHKNSQRAEVQMSDMSEQSQSAQEAKHATADRLVSVITGKVRVFLPDAAWVQHVDGVGCDPSAGMLPPPCVSVLLDHATISSTTWQELSLDGLGYPPFNSALLPRRVARPLQLRRITSDTPEEIDWRRRTSRLGNISGAIVEWVFASDASDQCDDCPLDRRLGSIRNVRLVSREREAFLRPFSVTVDSNRDPSATAVTDIAVTKIRAEVSKATFDCIVLRTMSLLHAAVAVVASAQKLSQESPHADEEVKAQPLQRRSPQRLDVVCDGVDVVVAQESSSIHVRVGSLAVQQSSLVDGAVAASGVFSVQNIVVALRHPHRGVATTTTEELVLGPNSDPCTWQLDVGNAPHKLISGRWTRSESANGSAESSIFIDVQGLQAHVSSHVLDEIAAYIRLPLYESHVVRRSSWSVRTIGSHPSPSGQPIDWHRSNKVGVKLLLGSSITSFWIRDDESQYGAAIWTEIDQVFTSVEKGSDDDKITRALGQQPLRALERLVVMPGMQVAATVDKFIVRTSTSYVPLTVRFKTDTLTAIPGQIQSSWVAFLRLVSQSSARTTLLQESTIRITCSRSVVVERIGASTVLETPISMTSLHVDPSSLAFKVSAASLAALTVFIDRYNRLWQSANANQPPRAKKKGDVYTDSKQRDWFADFEQCSHDDFATLRHRTELSSSPPRPGDVVFSEALLVETATGPLPVLSMSHLDLVVDFEPSRILQHTETNGEGVHSYDETADVLHWIELVNEPWNPEDDDGAAMSESLVPPSAVPDTHTTSWMSLKWCYHLPRTITEIVIDPVPVPPAGVPSDWPIWCWKEDPEARDSDRFVRLCDVVCQLRVWDPVKGSYVAVAEFSVPWEAPEAADRPHTLKTPGSFGDLMSVFFDADTEEGDDQAKFARVLEVTCCRRTLKLHRLLASDKWELRWRSPLSGEQDKHQRVHVSALLAASLNVRSQLVASAIPRVDVQCTFPLVSIAAAYVQGHADASHDVVSVGLNDTLLSFVGYAADGGSKIVFQSELQVVFDNLAQLLTVPIIPRVELHGLIDRNVNTGTQISLALGDARVYLPQSAILLLTSLSDILTTSHDLSLRHGVEALGSSLPVLRVQLVNACGRDVWYRQFGTRECLRLRMGEQNAYSWLTLHGDPSYDCLQFAVGVDDESLEPSDWCDPCRVREQVVTSRYFQDAGFLWISVERCGTVTTVFLRGSVNWISCLPESVFVQVEKGSQNPVSVKCRRRNDPVVALKCLELREKSISLNDGSSLSLPHALQRVGCMVDGAATSLRFGVGHQSADLVERGELSYVGIDVQDLPVEFKTWSGDSGVSRARCTTHLQLQGVGQDDNTQYVVVEVVRSVQPATMPNDFVHERIVPRHTWIDIYMLPSLQLVNSCDASLFLGLYAKGDQPEKISISAHERVFCSAVDPRALRALTLQTSSGEVSATCSLAGESLPGMFQLGPLCFEVIPPSATNPLFQILLRRRLVVINRSSSTVLTKIRLVIKEIELEETKSRACTLRLEPETVMSPTALALPSSDQATVSTVTVSISLVEKETRDDGMGDTSTYSSEIELMLTTGYKAVVRCPMMRPRTLCEELTEWDFFSPFVVGVEMDNAGSIKLMVSALVTVHNDTGLRLRLLPSLCSTSAEDIVESGSAWEVPVRQVQDMDKSRTGAAGVTSWLSSAFGYGGGKTRASSFAFGTTSNAAATTCSFQTSVASADDDDGSYSWTADIPVRVPEGSLTGKSSKSTLLSLAYPPPSSVSTRHRRLVRHSAMRHIMLTITVSQLDDSTIHVLVFIDRQTPLAVENMWSYPVWIRAMSSRVMTPDAIAGQYYMEYDWSVQRRTSLIKSKSKDDAISLNGWLIESATAFEGEQFGADLNETSAKFQLGLPGFGWSNVLWQVSGIQFARFATSSSTMQSPVFLVATSYRAGTWFISISCLDDPASPLPLTSSPPSSVAQPLVSQSAASEQVAPVSLANRFRLVVSTELVRFHFCDEHSLVPTERTGANALTYKEIFRLTLRSPCVSFISTADAPAALQTEARLGYMKHVRSYNVLFAGLEKLEVEHSLDSCNFPVMLSVKLPTEKRDDFKVPAIRADVVATHDTHWQLLSNLMAVELPDKDARCLAVRIINVSPSERLKIPSYFQSVELRLAPAVIQLDDEIMAHIQAFIRPIADALTATRLQHSRLVEQTPSSASWRATSLRRLRVTSQKRIFIHELSVSDLEITVTARMSIPVLNSLDGTPLRFSARKMRRVFTFSDQLIKDLAAEYVADVLVRSPLLIMSLNIFGNPAGFVRSVGAGVRDLFEIPIAAASRDGYNPWVLTRGVCSGITSLVGHTSAAALSSLSGFTYSISRTVDHLTLTPEQLRRRHYVRPTHLSSGIAGGLGSLGSSVVGAATGVVRTPIALYQEKRERGLRAGVGDVVGGLGMGIVGIVARPMGGLASLLAMTSDGILNGTGMGEQMRGDDDDLSLWWRATFEARPNDELRAKLKILCDPSVGDLVLAHGACVDASAAVLSTPVDRLRQLTLTEMEDDRVRDLFSAADRSLLTIVVSVICTRTAVYVVGIEAGDSTTGSPRYEVVSKTALVDIHTIEESLTEPARLDIGVRSSHQSAWYRLRLAPAQRRHLSQNLRKWYEETHGRGFAAS